MATEVDLVPLLVDSRNRDVDLVLMLVDSRKGVFDLAAMGVDLVLREVDLDREWQSTVAVQAGRNEQVFFCCHS
jgi:DNA-binding transcriptional LysR family regulator